MTQDLNKEISFIMNLKLKQLMFLLITQVLV